MIDCAVYTFRRHSLAFKVNEFRQAIAHHIGAVSEHHIVDCMPVEVCKLVATQLHNHGYYTAQKRTILVTNYRLYVPRVLCFIW